ncbi:MAG: hypothetical protein FWG63_06880 [Defluviitaleaceae bacterium]|nr:hypothetical protein [Defluviitaleaceae bacterium]
MFKKFIAAFVVLSFLLGQVVTYANPGLTTPVAPNLVWHQNPFQSQSPMPATMPWVNPWNVPQAVPHGWSSWQGWWDDAWPYIMSGSMAGWTFEEFYAWLSQMGMSPWFGNYVWLPQWGNQPGTNNPMWFPNWGAPNLNFGVGMPQWPSPPAWGTPGRPGWGDQFMMPPGFPGWGYPGWGYVPNQNWGQWGNNPYQWWWGD